MFMKKLYSLLLAVLLTSFFTTASAKQFTVNIAHAEHIGSVQVNYEEVEFVEGDAESRHPVGRRRAHGF